MKKLLPFLVLLASCSTVHKVMHKEQKSTDSTAAVTRDTSFRNTTTTQTDDLDVKDLDVTVYYSPADSALAVAIAKPVDRAPMKTGHKKLDQYAELIKEAISGAGNVAAIQIHIGSISDSTAHTITVDTGSAHTQTDTHVKIQEKQEDKKVDRTGLSLGAKIGMGFALLIGLIVFLLWLAKKIHII